jgi:hypothetical protein
MGTPVNVGPRVPPTQNRASVVGGWGVQAFNSAMPKAPSLASPMTAPTGYRPKDADQIQRSLYGSNKQIYDRVPIGKQFKELGIGYDERIPAAPLGPREYSPYGMDIPTVVGRPNLTPEQQAQAGAELQRREQELRDFLNREADPFPTGNPNMAGNPTVAQSRKENPLVGTGYGTFNIAGVDRIMAAPENLPPEKTPTEARDRSFSNSFASSAAAATPGSVDLRGAGYGTFNVPKSAQIDAEIRGIERDINAPSISEKEKILKIENVPESSGMSFTPGLPKKSKEFGDRLVTINGVTREVSPSQMSKLTPKDQNKIADYLQKVTYTPPKELRSTAGTWTQSYDVPLSEKRITVKPDDQIAGDVYGPKNVDPKVQELMRDVDKMNRRGTRIAKSVPVVGAGFRIADAFRDVFTGKNTAESDADLKRAYMQGSPAQRAALEKKNPNLTKFAQLAGLKPQLPMSNYENWRQRSFGFGGSGIGNSTVSGGSTDMSDIRGGGKNKPIRVASAEEKTPTPKAKSEPKEGGRRPAIYYKWDLGIDVPSPTDSDYTLYTKYLQEKAAAKAGMA